MLKENFQAFMLQNLERRVMRVIPLHLSSQDTLGTHHHPVSDDSHDKVSKKELLSGKKKDKRDSKKDRGYATLQGESSGEEMETDLKSPSKIKKPKSFKFPSTKKEKKEKTKEKESKEVDVKEEKKKDKKEKETKVKIKLKEKKKSKCDDGNDVEEQPVFGMPLSVAVERSRCHDGIDLPVIVRDCIQYIEEHGLNQEGIYRSSGIKSKVQQLKHLYDHREQPSLSDYEPPIIASLFKLFLRELPEPVLTNDLIAKFEEVAALKDDEAQETELKLLISQLPLCNQLLLSWIFVHMMHVVEKEKQNKMNMQNVSIVLSPSMQISHSVLNALFHHNKSLFDGVVLKKYIPPITLGSKPGVQLPESPGSIEEEVQKQESLLSDIHREMNAGAVSKRREDQLWEAQRILTQLKRKLRNSRKSVQENPVQTVKCKSENENTEDDLKIDLTLQTVKANGQIDKQQDKVEACGSTVVESKQEIQQEAEIDKSKVIENETEVLKDESTQKSSVSDETPSSELLCASDEKEDNETENMLEEVKRILPTENVINQELVPEKEVEEDVVSDDIQYYEWMSIDDLENEELLLRMQYEELFLLNSVLQQRLQSEQVEVLYLHEKLTELQSMYPFSSDDTSDSDVKEDSNTNEKLAHKLAYLIQENKALKSKKASLCQQILSERELCINLRIEVQSHELKHQKLK